MSQTELEERFRGIGLADATAKYAMTCFDVRNYYRYTRRILIAAFVCRTAVKNKKLTHELEAIIAEAGVSAGCPKQQGTLLYD